MSNHPSDNTKGRLLRRALAGLLTLALMLGLLPASVFTAHAASWADPYVQTLVDWGVMRGDIGGNMAPDRSITRAEFVTMMNRAYGYTKLGGHPFTDVRVRDWYSEDIDIAYNIGYFKGTSDTTASPNASLTREQAAVLLARNMMLQETVGETLGFSDTRRLSDWSRGLVGAAAANGIISGYEDGSFQPMRNITRGEVAAMLVRAIGTPIQSAGDHALGNVYGNVTVNASGVKLRDGVIVGNLYLTGGIDLGDVLLENVTVLGEIVVSGGGESNSSQSSIILRNVVADKMIVDSIGDQFVTIRAEGNTDIPTTTVRTNAYVDDSSLPGYGLSYIELDGEEGALYQLAGNIKEAVNKTPGSDLQIVQGIADKVTVDEKATGSSVLVDGDAQVGELNLDTGTDVTGTGDIKDLNVGSSGSTVEQLPDNIVIRPGINADIAGSNMNSTQGAESSADPKLLAGYPAVRKIAPQSAELVFRVNKPGTIYWAVSAVADGSVSEADLLEPPVYGNKVLASGKISATAANTDYTAAVNRLTSGGSYYVTAMLVDGRDQHSPIKVTSFSTPDNSVPAFATGYPVMTLRTTEIAQATVMTTKSCLLYYALLPAGAKAPTEQEFKSAAIPGNLGYGSQSVTKNVTIPINVNNQPLEEKTNYVVYFWLVDHDGAQKSRVVALPFTTLDETPPIVTDAKQLFSNTTPGVDSIQVEYTIDEPADFVWAIVTEGQHMNHQFLDWKEDNLEPGNADRSTLAFESPVEEQAAKVQLASGAGARLSGTYSGNSPLTIRDAKLLFQNAKTSSFVLYYMADDNATNTGNLSEQIKALRVRTLDTTPPDASLRFNSDGAMVDKDPQSDADVHIVFTEQVKGTQTKDKDIFLNLYQDVLNAEKELENAENTDAANEATAKINSARNAMAKALDTYIELHQAAAPPTTNKVTVLGENDTPPTEGSWIDWRKAEIAMVDDGSGSLEIILPGVKTSEDGSVDRSGAGIQLEGGVAYYFRFRDIYDLAYPAGNSLVRTGKDPYYLPFTTSFANVQLTMTPDRRPPVMKEAKDKADKTLFTNNSTVDNRVPSENVDTSLYPDAAKNDPARIDRSFRVQPMFAPESVGLNVYYEILIWADTDMEITLYSKPYGDDTAAWTREGSTTFRNTDEEPGGYVYRSLFYDIHNGRPYEELRKLAEKDMEYVIHVDRLHQGNSFTSDYAAWNGTVNLKVSVVAGWSDYDLNRLTQIGEKYQETFNRLVPATLRSIGTPSDFPMEITFVDSKVPEITNISIVDSDTAPVITLFMKPGGAVNYLIFPLTELQHNKGGAYELIPSGVQITEAMIQGTAADYNIVSYNAPTSLRTAANSGAEAAIKDITPIRGASPVGGTPMSTPDADQVRLGMDNVQGVIKGSTTSVAENEAVRIEPKDLEPNTVYILLAATRGATGKSFSETPVAYRFTTSMPSRPVITLDGSSTDVTAIVDRTSTLRARLLVQTQIESLTDSIFAEKLKDKLDPNAGALPSEYADYTILKALYESVSSKYSQPGNNGRYPSVFDVYADQSTKQAVQDVVESGGTMGNTSVGSWGGEGFLVTVPGTSGTADITFDTKGLHVNTDYVCVAMARSATTGAYAFRAIYPLQVLDNKPPSVDASGGFSVNDKGQLNEGTIMVSFDQTLWRKGVDDGKLYPVEHDANHGTVIEDGFAGLQMCFNHPSFLKIETENKKNGPIAAVTFKLIMPTPVKTFTITLNAGAMFNQWGTAIPRTVINVRVDENGEVTCTYS